MAGVISVSSVDNSVVLTNDTIESDSSAGASFDAIMASKGKTLEEIFDSVSKEYDVPVKLLKAVAQAESDFDTNAVSSCGASGIMQLMPSTAKGLGVEDVFDPEQNITGGAKMLAYLLDDYDGDTTLALAAYNAGSGAVAKYGGVPPYEETRNYINRINNILEGGLEKDLSYIVVNKGGSGTMINNDGLPSTAVIKANIINKTPQESSKELFSYDDYLRFIEIYQKLLDSMLFDSTDDKKDNSYKNLYELESSNMGFKLNSIFNN